jgi:hypothetical protein
LRGKKNGQHWEDVVGYTLKDLMSHLETLFEPGMSWDNYGEWEIDHIRPKSSFRFESIKDSQFKECWGLNNLQPLWESDNAKKNAKYFPELAVCLQKFTL